MSVLKLLSIKIGCLTLDDYESLIFLNKITIKFKELTDCKVVAKEKNCIGN